MRHHFDKHRVIHIQFSENEQTSEKKHRLVPSMLEIQHMLVLVFPCSVIKLQVQRRWEFVSLKGNTRILINQTSSAYAGSFLITESSL